MDLGIIKAMKMILRKNSTGTEYRRRRLNVIEGANVTLTMADDPTDNEVDLTIAAASQESGFICIADQKSQGTNGGTFTSGAWRTRDLNTELADTGNHASVATNQITLAAGTYRVLAILPFQLVNYVAARLHNVTDDVVLVGGGNGYNYNGFSFLAGRFTLSGAKVLELQHQCSTTAATTGLGVAGNFAVETYSTILLWRE